MPGLCSLDVNSIPKEQNGLESKKSKSHNTLQNLLGGKEEFCLSYKLTKEIEVPELYALPVRPIRCTYPVTLRGISKFITCSSAR